ncbi:hypothetical protein B0T20DRAFT_207992 [Sordaria brevicollis]|uniref:Uncharacterized protein n=1 Tax=Sordaria brevicollis TaxID=83679 RepID=A0AAE0PEC7_SORBR|nr:hypothetical protein B0T20DRAFT_207992 [Sordaria brevicollis]
MERERTVSGFPASTSVKDALAPAIYQERGSHGNSTFHGSNLPRGTMVMGRYFLTRQKFSPGNNLTRTQSTPHSCGRPDGTEVSHLKVRLVRLLLYHPTQLRPLPQLPHILIRTNSWHRSTQFQVVEPKSWADKCDFLCPSPLQLLLVRLVPRSSPWIQSFGGDVSQSHHGYVSYWERKATSCHLWDAHQWIGPMSNPITQ